MKKVILQTSLTKAIDAGIYTFYNEKSGCYLSSEGKSLILSKDSSNWNLKAYSENSFYICANESELLLDIDNAFIAEGTTIKLWKLTGYNVQIWNVISNANGTCSIVSSANNDYCLGFDNDNAVLQLRDVNNPMQEWKITEILDSAVLRYCRFISNGGIIELQLPLKIENVISESRLQQWANELEMAYYSFYELTNFIPYKKIIVEAYKTCEHIGYVINDSNIIHIDSDFICEDLRKMSKRKEDWNFCALHEMGHMFDNHRPWVFEAELMTDLKVAYVLEMNNTSAVPSEFDESFHFYGNEIKNAYKILGSDFNAAYNVFGCAFRFLQIKEDIGWKPFKQTFHNLQKNYDIYINSSRQEMFENFIDKLSCYSGRNIKEYFSDDEWNSIIKKVSKKNKLK